MAKERRPILKKPDSLFILVRIITLITFLVISALIIYLTLNFVKSSGLNLTDATNNSSTTPI